MSKNVAVGKLVILVHTSGEESQVASTATIEGAAKVAKLLNRARILNDVKRRYTAAARLIADAEVVEGFKWLNV